MKGDAGTQYKNVFKVIGVGEHYAWMNTATGYVGSARYNTYDEANAVIEYMMKEVQARSKE